MNSVQMVDIEPILIEIFDQTEKGKVEIGEDYNKWVYDLKFFVKTPGRKLGKIDGIVLNIPNWENFVSNVAEYLEASDWFFDGYKEYMDLNDRDALKDRILHLLVNISSRDCDDIYKYVKARTKMFQSQDMSGSTFLGRLNIPDNQLKHFAGLEQTGIRALISKNNYAMAHFEAPYSFTPFFNGEQRSSFELPSIIYGIADDKIYVVAIQNLRKEKQTSPFAKKMDRFLRKVNSGFDEKSLSEEEQELALVSPNALVSLSIFAQFMQDRGLRKIVAPAFLPVRYSNKVEGAKRKLEPEQLTSALERTDEIQYNMTNKFTNTLFRFSRHFPRTSCQYDDTTMTTYLDVDTTKPNGTDNIIYDITKSVESPSRTR